MNKVILLGRIGKIENKGKKIYVSESQLMLFANGFDK